MAEAFNSLFKGELIHNPIVRGCGWQSVREVEIVVAEYVDWYNHRRSMASSARALRLQSKPLTERHATINPPSPPGLGDRQRDGTVPRSVFPARHAGLRSGGMGTVSDDIGACESTQA
jgi:hypothetical protein